MSIGLSARGPVHMTVAEAHGPRRAKLVCSHRWIEQAIKIGELTEPRQSRHGSGVIYRGWPQRWHSRSTTGASV
jgi:hypothetical protein